MVAIVIGPRLDTRFDCFFAWSADFHIASDEYRGNRLLSEKTSKIDSVDFSMGCFIHLGVRSHILHWVSYCLLCCKAVPVCSGYRNSLANTVKCRLAQPCCLSAYACLSATGSICRNSGSKAMVMGSVIKVFLFLILSEELLPSDAEIRSKTVSEAQIAAPLASLMTG